MNTKNLVFMMDIDLGGDGRYSSSRRFAYKYSIDSWKKWCDKNNCELFVLNDLVLEKEKMGICWQRYYLFDILDANELEYDQVLMIDADTIVHPDQTPVNMLIHQRGVDLKLLPYEFNMSDMTRKEILGDDLLFTKIGWIYQYNAIPNNKDNQISNYFMQKTYEHFYGKLSD
jgi:hypothetical protein